MLQLLIGTLVALMGGLPEARSQEEAAVGKAATTAAEPVVELAGAKVLILTGDGDDAVLAAEVFKAGLQERTVAPIEWVTETADRLPVLLSHLDWAEGYDLIVHLHRLDGADSPEVVSSLLEAHGKGVPGMVIDGALSSFHSEEWAAFCGAKVSAVTEVDVLNVIPDPGRAFQGWSSPREKLVSIDVVSMSMASWATANGQPVIWSHPFKGDGFPRSARVFVNSLGNDVDGFHPPQCLDAMTLGFLWALERDVGSHFRVVAPEDSLTSLGDAYWEARHFVPGDTVVLRQRAMAMSEDAANGAMASAAVDGKGNTYWRASRPGPSVWEVSWDKAATVAAVAVEWLGPEPDFYSIEGSLDGVSWSQFARREGVRLADAERSPFSLFVFPEREVRTIRVSIPQTRKGEHPGIRELAAYADERDIPESFLEKVGASDGLTEVAMPKLSPLVRVNPQWKVSRRWNLEEGPELPKEFVESSDGNGFILLESVNGKREVRRMSGKSDSGPFLRGLAEDASIAWDGEWLYVLSQLELSRYRDTDKDGVADEKQHFGKIFHGEGEQPLVSSLKLAYDGWVYGIFSADEPLTGSDASKQPVNLPRHGLVRFRRDGSAFQLFASSRLPIVGFHRGEALDWVVEQVEGGETVSHYLHRGVFPKRLVSSFPTASPELVTYQVEDGFILANEGAEAPTLVAQIHGVHSVFPISNGVLAVVWSETGRNYVKIVRREVEDQAPVNLDAMASSKLPALLKSGPELIRKAALFEMLRRKRDWLPTAQRLLKQSGEMESSMAAALLGQIPGRKSFDMLVAAAKSKPTPEIFRILGDRPESGNHAVLTEIVHVKEPEISTEILTAIAKSDSNAKGLSGFVLPFVAQDNATLANTAREWLIARDAGNVCFEAIDDPDSSQRLRVAALSVLASLPKKTVAEGLVLRLEQTDDREFRREGLKALSQLYFDDAGATWAGTPLIDSFLRASLTDPRVDRAWLLDHLLSNRIPIRDLEDLAEIAATEAPLQPATVALMLEQGQVPSAALSWLEQIAISPSHDPSYRARALSLLNPSWEFDRAFQTTSRLLKLPLIPVARERLVQSWLTRSDLAEKETLLRWHSQSGKAETHELARLSLEAIAIESN